MEKITMKEVTTKRGVSLDFLCEMTWTFEPTRGTIYDTAAYGIMHYIQSGRASGTKAVALKEAKGAKAWKLIELAVEELEASWHLTEAPARAVERWVSANA